MLRRGGERCRARPGGPHRQGPAGAFTIEFSGRDRRVGQVLRAPNRRPGHQGPRRRPVPIRVPLRALRVLPEREGDRLPRTRGCRRRRPGARRRLRRRRHAALVRGGDRPGSQASIWRRGSSTRATDSAGEGPRQSDLRPRRRLRAAVRGRPVRPRAVARGHRACRRRAALSRRVRACAQRAAASCTCRRRRTCRLPARTCRGCWCPCRCTCCSAAGRPSPSFRWLARRAPWTLREPADENTFIKTARSDETKRDDLLERVRIGRTSCVDCRRRPAHGPRGSPRDADVPPRAGSGGPLAEGQRAHTGRRGERRRVRAETATDARESRMADIERFTLTDRRAIDSLYRRVFGQHAADANRLRWEWQYARNPNNPDGVSAHLDRPRGADAGRTVRHHAGAAAGGRAGDRRLVGDGRDGGARTAAPRPGRNPLPQPGTSTPAPRSASACRNRPTGCSRSCSGPTSARSPVSSSRSRAGRCGARTGRRP